MSEQNAPSSFASGLSEADVVRILFAPQVRVRLGDRLPANPQVTPLGGCTFQVSGIGGDDVMRFPGNAWHLSMLKIEERVQARLRDWVTLHIPDTHVVDDLNGIPPLCLLREWGNWLQTSEVWQTSEVFPPNH
ncbi:MAG: hypothetical protein ISS56_18990 [Anaerolineae bacterium]|nr:hypothetical protein [Anaerolineae bacterium]